MNINVLRFSDYEVLNHMENVLLVIEDYIVQFEENGFTPPLIPPF